MKVICGGRQTGRTSKLIAMAAEAEANGEVCYIVCHSQQEASRIFRDAQDKGLSIGFPITIYELMNNEYSGRNIKKFYIDNAEFLLQSLTRVPIDTITITTEES